MLDIKIGDLVKVTYIQSKLIYFGIAIDLIDSESLPSVKLAYFVENYLSFPAIEFLTYNENSSHIELQILTYSELLKERKAKLGQLENEMIHVSRKINYMKKYERDFDEFFLLHKNIRLEPSNTTETPSKSEMDSLCLAFGKGGLL